MLNRFQSALAALLIFALCLLPAHGALLENFDFETNDFQGLNTSGNAPTITGNGTWGCTGGYTAQYWLDYYNSEVPFRTEFTGGSQIPLHKNSEYWLGFAVYLPGTAAWEAENEWVMDPSDGSEIILQIHHTPDPGQPYVNPPFGITAGSDGLWHAGGKWDASTERTKNYDGSWKADLAPIQLGKWTEFVLNFTIDPNGNGFIKIWVDGEQALSRTNGSFGYNDIAPHKIKFGIYKPHWKDGTWQTGPVGDIDTRLYWGDNYRLADASSNFTTVDPDCDANNAVGGGGGGGTTTVELLTPSTHSYVYLPAENLALDSLGVLTWTQAAESVGGDVRPWVPAAYRAVFGAQPGEYEIADSFTDHNCSQVSDGSLAGYHYSCSKATSRADGTWYTAIQSIDGADRPSAASNEAMGQITGSGPAVPVAPSDVSVSAGGTELQWTQDKRATDGSCPGAWLTFDALIGTQSGNYTSTQALSEVCSNVSDANGCGGMVLSCSAPLNLTDGAWYIAMQASDGTNVGDVSGEVFVQVGPVADPRPIPAENVSMDQNGILYWRQFKSTVDGGCIDQSNYVNFDVGIGSEPGVVESTRDVVNPTATSVSDSTACNGFYLEFSYDLHNLNLPAGTHYLSLITHDDFGNRSDLAPELRLSVGNCIWQP